MSALRSRFQRDCLYLSQGLCPKETSGKEVTALDYEIDLKKGEEAIDRLEDDDIIQLADSIANNNKFIGPLNLDNNNLSDIAALHIGRILRDGDNIKRLILN
jgi:hypothetical protein